MMRIPMDRESQIARLNEEIKDCRDCKARDEATCPVPGVGNPYAELMFIGRNPGHEEDAAGEPFVGRSGKEQSKQLADLDLTRADVFITNLILCYTFKDRPPEPSEIKACFKYLKCYLDIVRPKLVVTYGAQPAKYLAGIGSITRGHGVVYKHKAGFYIVTCVHPGAQLHNQKYKQMFEDDTIEIAKAIKDLNIVSKK